jgi:hypothetical protein
MIGIPVLVKLENFEDVRMIHLLQCLHFLDKLEPPVFEIAKFSFFDFLDCSLHFKVTMNREHYATEISVPQYFLDLIVICD